MIVHVLTNKKSSLSRRSWLEFWLFSRSCSSDRSRRTRDPRSFLLQCGRFLEPRRHRLGLQDATKTNKILSTVAPPPLPPPSRRWYCSSNSSDTPLVVVLPALPQPRPPMPRIHPRVLVSNNPPPHSYAPRPASFTSTTTSTTATTTATTTGLLGRCTAWWKQDGSWLIALGWTGLTLIAIDQSLQYYDRQQARETIAALAKEQRDTRQQLFQLHAHRPTLYECIVKHPYRMGGTHGLAGNVKMGDVVQVLQEGVGPGQQYVLCRRMDQSGDIQVGWYPTGFLEKKPAEPLDNQLGT